MQRSHPWAALAGFIALCLLVGAAGGWATSQAVIDWYPTLNKPAWNPPPWIFAPVWTTLYIVMAIAAWLVWKRDARFSGVRLALMLFFAQLAVNCLWSFLFFKFHNPAAALVDIVALLILLALTTAAFFSQSKLAGILMLPYLAWVGFATFLNYTIWQLN
jgi:translocator protein